MYRVVKPFSDLMDNGHAYLPGDAFPREGLAVSAERLEFLSGRENRLGVPVIAETREPRRGRKKKMDQEGGGNA